MAILLALSGCNPQDAELSDASYHTWLANGSSATVDEARRTCGDGKDNDSDGKSDRDDIDCRGPVDQDGNADNTSFTDSENHKCNDGKDNDGDGLADEEDPDCLRGISEADYLSPENVRVINCTNDEIAGDCKSDETVEHFSWLTGDTYFLNQGEITPWRSEGILTNEGDFQLTVHHDLGNGEDFRFTFVVDPKLRPSVCIQEGQTCFTGEDNDGDGLVDHEDPDCLYGGWEIGYTSAECNDGFDNDTDGSVDMNDPDCQHGYDNSEASTDPTCVDGEDNDEDGWVDDDDPDCDIVGQAEQGFGVTECNNGINDDGDVLVEVDENGVETVTELIDADDPECANAKDNDEDGVTKKTRCSDSHDNDGDGWVDDEDPDCDSYNREAGWSVLACNDGIDNDGDTLIDNEDPGCLSGGDTNEEDNIDDSCVDGEDNDEDGWTDTEDPDCVFGTAEDNSYYGLSECNDGIDNPDEDGELDEDIDSDDRDCKSALDNAENRIPSGSCNDGEDNDNDGWTDEADPNCANGGEASFGITQCNDGMDNDNDGDIDADDADCMAGEQNTEASGGADCADGVDNDGDSWIDGADGGCRAGGLEADDLTTECSDGIDNDGDTLIDSEDEHCHNSGDVSERTYDQCADELDNDGDGWVDMDDADCTKSSIAYERGMGSGRCADLIDNDGDGLIDGDDDGCTNSEDEWEEEFDQCTDGIDNDEDGWLDALDPDCGRDTVLEDGSIAVSECNDGEDNDGDGTIDIADADCNNAWDNSETTAEAGEPIPVDIDYAPVLEKWAEDEDGYSIHYLNAGSYQQNPANDEEYWSLPQEWLSGYAIAKYGAEEFDVLPNDFLYVGADATNPNPDGYSQAVDTVTSNYATYAEELQRAGFMVAPKGIGDGGRVVDIDGEETPLLFDFKIEDNAWRPIDLATAGLDNWIEAHHSWVRIKDGSTFEVGEKVEGDFQIYLAGFESASNLVVRGTFVVNELGDDPWGYGVLEDEMREKNGTVPCEF